MMLWVLAYTDYHIAIDSGPSPGLKKKIQDSMLFLCQFSFSWPLSKEAHSRMEQSGGSLLIIFYGMLGFHG